MSERQYFKVEKMPFDELWHACFVSYTDCLTYDRVNLEEAIEISKRLVNQMVIYNNEKCFACDCPAFAKVKRIEKT